MPLPRRIAESANVREHIGIERAAEHVYDTGCGCLTCLSESSASEKPVATEIQAGTHSVADEPTGSIAVGGTASGLIDSSGDVDAFTVSLVAGQTYMVSLQGSGGTPLQDPYLTLANPGGTIVASDDDGGIGIDSLLTFTASTTGTYQIIAAAYPDSGLTGGYTIDVRQKSTDSVGSTIGTATPIAVDSTTFGFIETSRDVDMFSVSLTAGTLYSFDLAGGADYDTNPNSVPTGELDTRITIYDAAGNVVATNDDVSYPDDLSSSISLTAETTGTYYIKVDAYPRQTGGFILDVQEIDLAELDPLDSIDWGTQLPSNNVTVYFAANGETFDGVSSLGWTQYEIDQAMAALQTWSEVSNLTFTITNSSAGATFKLVTTTSSEFLGYFNPPGTTNAGVGVFATNGTGWNATGGLEEGGYGFITLVHEFGHGLGLAHPHDNGGTSTVMPGVTSPFDSYGVFDLNQGVYTTMSYNDGWQLHPSGANSGSLNYGYQGGPGAFDIALIQLKYGASSANTGDNVYVLPTANAAGTFWDVIWDTGGVDTIAHTGTVSARIDLTAATLDYSPTGAGVISFVSGIYGGFTIAAGVVIENASGGSGADVLIGNSASNVLDGGAGNDTLEGRGGTDTFRFATGDGQDTVTDLVAGETVEISGYASAQSVTQDGTSVVVVLSASDRITFQSTTVATVQAALVFPDAPPAGPTEGDDVLTGTAGDDTINGLGGNDTINGLGGNDEIHGGLGSDDLFGGAGDDTIYGEGGYDEIDGGAGNDTIYASPDSGAYMGGDGDDTIIGTAGLGDRAVYSSATQGVTVSLAITGPQSTGQGTDTLIDVDHLFGSEYDDVLTGNDGGNQLAGMGGNDQLFGGAGLDELTGGLGNDYLDGGAGADDMYGHAGDDTYIVDEAGDQVHEDAGGGIDTVYSSISFELIDFFFATSLNIENLTLVGSADIDGRGDGYANILTGNSGANQIFGGGGNDQLFGAEGDDLLIGQSGNDTLDGGAGIDTASYEWDSAAVTVSLAITAAQNTGGSGSDTLANVENLTGSAFADNLTGNSVANVLLGLAGDDIIRGGAGNDTLSGGEGNDHFEFSAGTGQDTITDFAVGDSIIVQDYTEAESITQVAADVVVVLSTGDRLTLLNADAAKVAAAIQFEGAWIVGTEGADTMAGTDGDDLIRALAGNDTVNAGAGSDVLDGGAGDDKMNGGTGDDIYYVDSTLDVVTELSNQGIDEVRTTITYTLGRNVENGRLEGTGAINLTGNALNNVLTGNSSANILTGGNGNDTLDGGAGADSLVGGKGNDIYYVDNALDSITEGRRGGTDELRASVDYTLAGGVEVETLTAIGSSAVNLTGNALAQTLQGNDGDNFLYGLAGNDTLMGSGGADTLRGGAGNDVLSGGSGADLFVFEASNGADVITDFVSGTDKLDFRLLLISSDNVETAVSGGNTIISVDANGDGRTDFTITLTGVTEVAPSDYIFG